ncbi:HBL/NHE enterotoxin family protein [Aerosakkonema funiforme]|uniref:HBL/NHE enterotoxin family protein n=1 Tax=Aerosakkonema funiforme TaxID=1246630 RepID=UPI0035B78738
MTFSRTINSSKVANNLLVPRYIKDDISKTSGALLLMQTYATRILQQSELSLNLHDRQAIASDLDFYRKLCDRHASYLLNSLTPSLISAISDIDNYAQLFQDFYVDFLELAAKINKEDDAFARLIALLDNLEMEAKKRKDAAQQMVEALHKFNAQIKIDRDNFNFALERLNQKISNPTEVVDKLSDPSKALQQEIKKKITGVLAASLLIISGAGVIGFECLSALSSNTTAISIILGGISVIIAGSGALIHSGSSLVDYSHKVRTNYQQNPGIYTDIVLANSLAEHFDSLCETTNYILESHKSLSLEWSSIVTGIRRFKQEIIRTYEPSKIAHLEDYLNFASREWHIISQRAQKMLFRVVCLPPEEVNEVLNLSSQNISNSYTMGSPQFSAETVLFSQAYKQAE